MEKGFAALAQDIANSKTEVTDVKSAVAQLGAEMREGFADIRTELTDIRHRLEALESAVQNISGYAKEIDHLIKRVSAIEKHLGLRCQYRCLSPPERPMSSPDCRSIDDPESKQSGHPTATLSTPRLGCTIIASSRRG